MVGSAAQIESPSARDVDHTLLCVPAMAEGRMEICRSLVAEHGENPTVVAVTFHDLSPGELSSFWSADVPTPAAVDIVRVRDTEPSERALDGFASLPFEVATETVAPSRSLTELGTTIRERLTAAHEDSSEIVLCLDSITALLLYADETPTRKFLDSVRTAVDDAGATGYYHLDHAAHDDQLVNRLGEQFDAVVEADAVATKR